MRVLSVKPGHDGAVSYFDGHRLAFSLEGEKDSFDRHSELRPDLLLRALEIIDAQPDIVAIGGWHKPLPGTLGKLGAGYEGLESGTFATSTMLGRPLRLYASSHERSHLFGGVGMSPFDPAQSIGILVWEGILGAFYHWSRHGKQIIRHQVLDQPGARYAALFGLAVDSFPDTGSFPPSQFAGKLMALAGKSDGSRPSPDALDVIESLLSRKSLYPFHKGLYRRSELYNCGVDSMELWRAARYLTDRLFETFWDAAKNIFSTSRMPLVIVGGCGLNCEWNSRWRDSALFSDVFVPPCANDSGSAIGTGVDALAAVSGSCTIDWSVYSGAEFEVDDGLRWEGWSSVPVDSRSIARRLGMGGIVAWVEGRAEIGPRALGHRSLLAAATESSNRDTLNRIKGRESYRPIAPVCLQDDMERCFNDETPDPYMLYLRTVRNPGLVPAIAHDDGSARAQSLSMEAAPLLFDLLTEVKRAHGLGVLCNTSLNFPGRGFINRSSELLQFCEVTGINDAVINGRWLCRGTNESAKPREGRS